MDVGHRSRILILSGSRQAGKTTFCQRMLSQARQAGWQVAGVVCPARFEGGQKVGIEVVDVRSGERCLLASQLPGECTGPTVGPWTFSTQALEWGNGVLQRATPCDLLVVDELGPLEFDQGQGFTAGFEALRSQLFRLALVVIRPECLPQAQECWPRAEVISVEDAYKIGDHFTTR